MYTNEEKLQFSERLRMAVGSIAPDFIKAAELATQFNLRHPKQPVTNAATHKWLTAQAVPSIDKIETLALWLGVSSEWLRTGRDVVKTDIQFTELQKMMIENFMDLPVRQQKYIFEIVCDLKKMRGNDKHKKT